MADQIFNILESKGIKVPEHHVQPLLAQWEAYQQLKKSADSVKLADYDIGLKHVPGGDQA